MKRDFLRRSIGEVRRHIGTCWSIAYDHRYGIAGSAASIVIIAFLIEYSAFGNALRSLPVADQAQRAIAASDIMADGFSLNENGTYVSVSDTASLTVCIGSRYVENLAIKLSDGSSYDFSVSFIDPNSGRESVVDKDLNGSMTKGKFSFLTQEFFHIATAPDSIRIVATRPGVSISGIGVDNTYRFNFFRFAFFLSIGTIAIGLFTLRRTVGTRPEYAFLVIMIVSGSLFAFAEPRSYTSWDEFIHYKRADKVALKEVFTKTVNDIYATTNSVPYSYSANEQSTIDDHFDHDYKKSFPKKKSSGDAISPVAFISETYARVPYLPSGIAIFLGRMLHVPRHIVFVLAQWINLVIFSALVFASIRILKTGKLLLATVALLPTSVFLASNFSYDWWVTGFIALGLAILFRALQDPTRKLSGRETGLMIGSLVLGCAPKAIYFPLLLPLFLLKPSSFGSAKRYRYFVIAAIVSTLFVIASFVIPFLISGSDFSDGRGGKDVDAIGQARFILSDPFGYARILFGFLKDYLNPMNFGGLSISFAYMGAMKGFLLLLAVLAIVAATDRNDSDSRTDARTRWTFIIAIFVTAILISTSLYVSFTPVGSPIINGVQPRYLLPLLFPFLFVLGHPKPGIPTRFRNAYGIVVFGTLSVALLWGLWDLVIRLHY